jgi:multicomponent Na+:H+ antiporter subunit E
MTPTPLVAAARLARRTAALAGLTLFFAWQLVLANLRLAADVLRRRQRMRPGIVAVPLDARTDLEVAVLSNLITLTPGTLTLDVSSDRRTLYVHAAFVVTPEATVREIKHGFERRVLNALR